MFCTHSVPVSSLLLCGDNLVCVFLLFPDAKERSAKRFSVDGVFNYTSLLLSQEDDMLYVGAREALFALSLSDISKTKLQKNVRLIPSGLSEAKMAEEEEVGWQINCSHYNPGYKWHFEANLLV